MFGTVKYEEIIDSLVRQRSPKYMTAAEVSRSEHQGVAVIDIIKGLIPYLSLEATNFPESRS